MNYECRNLGLGVEGVLSCERNFEEGEKKNTGTPNKFRTRNNGLGSTSFCCFMLRNVY